MAFHLFQSHIFGFIFLDASPVFVFYILFFLVVVFFRSIRERTFTVRAKKLKLNHSYKHGGIFMHRTGNYGIALLNIFSVVVKADGKVYNAEIDFIRGYLFNRFFENNISARNLNQFHIHEGSQNSTVINGMLLFDEIYKEHENLDESCEWISSHIPPNERKELMWFLFRLAKVNRTINRNEERLLEDISKLIGVLRSDYDTIKAEFIKEKKKKKSFFNSYFSSYSELDKAYKTLGVTSSNTPKEIKLAFRKLARQFHPDKFAQDTKEKQAWAEDKFSEINAAYDIVSERRGIK